MKTGSLFTYTGEAYECTRCSSRKLCHSALSIGLTYKIVKMTGGEGIYCMLRGDEAVPYEVSLEPIVLVASSGRIREGAVTELNLDDSLCKTDCGMVEECPILFNALIANRRVRVIEVIGTFNCPERKLVLIKAEILE